MNERQKIAEATHFLGGMIAARGNQTAIRYELSAFLTAARTVLQYAYEEAMPKGEHWYVQAMTADPLLGFFKDLRDDNIHEMPVRPLRRFTTQPGAFIPVGDGEDQMLVPYPHEETVAHYEFRDRPGEDVYDLCRRYLQLLDMFVADGVARGWISG